MEERARSVAAMRALLDAAQNEQRSMTAEEENTYNQHDADVDRLTNEIQREERLHALESEQRASANGARNPQQRRQPGAGAQTEQRDATDTNEYRTAMLRYMITGRMGNELRTDAFRGETRDILGVSLSGDNATGAVLAPAHM